MYQDYSEFEKFYRSDLGKSLKYLVSLKLKKHIYVYEKEIIGFFGYGNPYLDLIPNKNNKIFNFSSEKIGIGKNLINKDYVNILFDEEKLPIEDNFFDHILVIHYLENVNNLKKNLRELWRVLSPEGTIYIILPNKKSSWNHSLNSPFSSGFGFSKNKIHHMFEDNFFETLFIERLIYFPPWNLSLIQKNKFLFEKVGSYFWKFFNGVYICAAKKRLYATTTQQRVPLVNKIKIVNKTK